VARYLLIEIDDNDKAEAFMESMKAGKSFVTVPNGPEAREYTVVEIQARTVGLFGKPTKFCECPDQDQRAAASKGAKYGWRVCPKCNLALSGFHEPKNLLDPEGTPPAEKPFYLMARGLGPR
jgi:hypothetical protein